MGVLLYIWCIFSEYLFLGIPLGGCFCISRDYFGQKAITKKSTNKSKNKKTKYCTTWRPLQKIFSKTKKIRMNRSYNTNWVFAWAFTKTTTFEQLLANKQPDLRKRRKVLPLNVDSHLSKKYLDSKTFEFLIYNGTLKYVEKHLHFVRTEYKKGYFYLLLKSSREILTY